jgi:large subunit ribosomal protein L23
MTFDQKVAFDLIKYPLLTEKTIRLFEQNQYSFVVSKSATKPVIKNAIEQLFGVTVVSVNTSTQGLKKRRFRNILRKKAQYKRAVVKLAPENSIKFLDDV